ncbi:AI-2E family transporter [Photobacterium sp. TY1-4]|uniref:AI-2E family transporter n=1 Tax=Photobacterium sp. TY1-4 TaxID=2899122 RepID=UPI0021BE0A1C|nr:AI-2E family transporter [Photobacterium sp. TY1-4]UXI02990.1 AI-2E family transporter [Photobacterium sp. TY1-4]
MKTDDQFATQAIDAAIKIGAVALLLIWCFSILRPFLMLLVWGAIIATALYPLAVSMHNRLGMSLTKASVLLSGIGVVILLVPLIALSTGIYTSAADVIVGLQDGTLTIPQPDPAMKAWPLVGEKLYVFVDIASTNLKGVLVQYAEPLKQFAGKMAGLLGSLGLGFVQFIISTLIAGAFMAHAEKCEAAFQAIADRLTGKHGEQLTKLSKTTVRSVVQGVIGVALIQSVFAGIGMVFAGVPAIALWMVAVLLIAIIQLPPIIALLIPIFIVFGTQSTVVAVLFLIWCLLVSASDAVLKPVLLSRGSETPMLVILLGALGGMAMSGIVGLFVGAVVLSLAYQLGTVWLGNEASGE